MKDDPIKQLPPPRYNPRWIALTKASNRLTDARGALNDLERELPQNQHSQLAALYNRLCEIQGKVETWLRLTPWQLDETEEAGSDDPA
jgi:hypothetical protein